MTAVWPPPQNQKWKLGCSECSSTLQWLQSNAPRIRSGSWAAVSAVQYCSDCSLSPPRIRSGSCAAVSAVQHCSDCSLTLPLTPHPQNQKWKLGCSECSSTLQWLQSNLPPGITSRTHVVACHLLVNVLWVTGFTHFTSWSGKSHKATNSSWDKSKHFYLYNSESG